MRLSRTVTWFGLRVLTALCLMGAAGCAANDVREARALATVDERAFAVAELRVNADLWPDLGREAQMAFVLSYISGVVEGSEKARSMLQLSEFLETEEIQRYLALLTVPEQSVLEVADEVTRYYLTIEGTASQSAGSVIRTLDHRKRSDAFEGLLEP